MVTEERALVRVLTPDHVIDVVDFLSARPEVLWMEAKVRLFPHNAGAVRLLQEGNSDETRLKKRGDLLASSRGINGTGQIIGIVDTGIDWDNCFFWESAKSETFPNRGMQPPFQRVERERRKVIGYNWYSDCALCNKCPEPIDDDRQVFTEINGLLVSRGAYKANFPNVELLSRESPRFYDTAGAAVFYNLTAQTQEVPSQFLAPGAGAFDFPVEIQVFVLRRRDMATFSVSNPDYSKCLNDCAQVANHVETALPVALEATIGGYGVIVYNQGLIVDANILLTGEIQFMTARKPCGDNGDDRSGHGTHVSGAAAGAAFGPASKAEEVEAASEYNGMGAGAQIYFTDVMQNADPNCNVPGKVCNRVAEMTVPLDTKGLLYKAAYDAGARVHLNSWGCKVQDGEAATACNRYDANAQDLDAFSWEHPDFLAVTAVGDAGESWASGTVASPATCKNCLSVGASDTFNEQYREAALYRDPMEDICDCKYPRSCSGSETVRGTFVEESNREALLAELPSCCDDTVLLEHELTDQEIPSRQTWSVFFPNISFFDATVQEFVKDNFAWATEGSSIEFDYQATSREFSTPNYVVSPPTIQVMILPRADFFEYFESGMTSCVNEGTATTDAACRPNPCLSDVDRQSAGTEMCYSRLSLTEDAKYEPIEGCAKIQLDDREIDDVHCHQGDCMRDPKPGDQTWTEGCPLEFVEEEISCCSGSFLLNFCINKPCNETGAHLRGIVRHSDFLSKVRSGYGVVIRNVALQPVRVSGKVTWRRQSYPCTLEQCCAEDAACCSTKYGRHVESRDFCRKCPRDFEAGTCSLNEASELPPWSSRGPAVSGSNSALRRVKPDLVAPGQMIISASSDGNAQTNGDFEVQCGARQFSRVGDKGCDILEADPYRTDAALIPKTGSSVSAGLVAGAAAVARQYLVDGWYPSGVRNESNTLFASPSAALLRAMLANSARSVGGHVEVYTHQAKPFCDETVQECPPWVPPEPTISRARMPPTPNGYEGFGRPELDKTLWFAESDFSFYIAENEISEEGFMHTYKFPVLPSDGKTPLKATLAWTDPPATPGAANVLVNDLDLLLQQTNTEVVYDVNTGNSGLTTVFVIDRGNDPLRLDQRDATSTTEDVMLAPGTSKEISAATNVTVVVVAYRLSSAPEYRTQKYSLVVTGLLRPRYHEWGGEVRTKMLFLLEEYGGGVGLFNWFDVFRKGFLVASDLSLRFDQQGPALSFAKVVDMYEEADRDGNREIDVNEFLLLAQELETGARRPLEPEFGVGPAPMEFLGLASEDEDDTAESVAAQLQPSRLYAAAAALAAVLLSVAAGR